MRDLQEQQTNRFSDQESPGATPGLRGLKLLLVETARFKMGSS